MPFRVLDATYVKARLDHQVVSHTVVIATGVTFEGSREALGVDVGDSSAPPEKLRASDRNP